MAIDLDKYLNYIVPKPTYLGQLEQAGLITAKDLENAKRQSMVQGLLGAGLSYLAQPKNLNAGSAVPYLAKSAIAGVQAAGAPYQQLGENALTGAKIADIAFERGQRESVQKSVDDFIAENPQFENIRGLTIDQKGAIMKDYYSQRFNRQFGPDRFQNQYLVRDNDSNQTFNAVYDKFEGKTFINTPTGRVPYTDFVKDKNVSIMTAGGAQKGMMTSSKFNELRQGLLEDEIGMKNLTRYLSNVQDIPTGYKRLGNQLSQWIKGMANDNDLTEQEVAQRVAEGRFQGLIGANRIETVGGGVMTEFDAQRVMQRLGGDPAALTTQPAIVTKQISDIFRDKYGRYQDNLEAYNIEVDSGYTNYRRRDPIQFTQKQLNAFSPDVLKELNLKPSDVNVLTFSSEQEAEAAINSGAVKKGDTIIINGQEFTIEEE